MTRRKEGKIMSKQKKKKKEITIDSFYTGNEQRTNGTEEDQGIPNKNSGTPMNQTQTLEDLKTQFNKQLRETKESWENNLKSKRVHLETEAHELKQENSVLKARIDQLENEAKKIKDDLKRKTGQKEDDQKPEMKFNL